MLNSGPVIDVSNINEKVYAFVRKRIIHLTYPPGHKINIRELQRELGVSPTPIKDALFRLAGEGMVEISSRRGTYVKDFTERDVGEIYETRYILEAGAVDIIAKQITDEELEELEQLYQQTLIDFSESEYALFMEKDSAFHTKIIQLTKNQILIDTYAHLDAHMQIVRFRFRRHNAVKLPWVDKDHEHILAGLKARNPDKVKEAIKEHFRKGVNAFLRGRP